MQFAESCWPDVADTSARLGSSYCTALHFNWCDGVSVAAASSQFPRAYSFPRTKPRDLIHLESTHLMHSKSPSNEREVRLLQEANGAALSANSLCM